jgi:multidrug efflux pump subunit AcrB
MNISAPFIKRPVGTSLLAAALLLSGALAFTLLPVAPLPQVEFPVIQVSAGLPGASPETMASAVATPLERQFGRIAGINQMTSTSQQVDGHRARFDLSRNMMLRRATCRRRSMQLAASYQPIFQGIHRIEK